MSLTGWFESGSDQAHRAPPSVHSFTMEDDIYCIVTALTNASGVAHDCASIFSPVSLHINRLFHAVEGRVVVQPFDHDFSQAIACGDQQHPVGRIDI